MWYKLEETRFWWNYELWKRLNSNDKVLKINISGFMRPGFASISLHWENKFMIGGNKKTFVIILGSLILDHGYGFEHFSVSVQLKTWCALFRRNLPKLKINMREKYTGFSKKKNSLVFYFHLRIGFKAKNTPTLVCHVPLSTGSDK